MTGFIDPGDQPLAGAAYRTRLNSAGVNTLGTPPPLANVAYITFETDVRMSINSVDPTAVAGGGRLIKANTLLVVRGLTSIAACRFIVVTGTIEANVDWLIGRAS